MQPANVQNPVYSVEAERRKQIEQMEGVEEVEAVTQQYVAIIYRKQTSERDRAKLTCSIRCNEDYAVDYRLSAF